MSDLKKYKDRKGNSVAHLYRDEVTLIFHAVIRVGKKIRKKSLETKDYLEALRAMPTALDELGKPQDAKAKKTNKLCRDYWFELVEEKVALEVRPPTLVKMDVIWRRHLDPFLGNLRPDEIHPGLGTDYVLFQSRKHPGQQFFNKYKYMRNLFKFMMKRGALRPDQIPELELSKKEKRHHDKKKGRILTDSERVALDGRGSPQFQLIYRLCDRLGSRKMEMGALLKDRIKRENGRILIALTEDDTKTGLPRVLAVPKDLEHEFEAQVGRSGDSIYLFPTKDGQRHIPQAMIDREWRQAKIDARIVGRLRFHDLRHSRATAFALANLNPVIACTILGMTLRIYQKTYLNLKPSDVMKAIDEIEKVAA